MMHVDDERAVASGSVDVFLRLMYHVYMAWHRRPRKREWEASRAVLISLLPGVGHGTQESSGMQSRLMA